VAADLAAIAGYLAGRRVLITGAGGSIGSELSRQIAAFGPGSLLLVDRDESALYHLHEDLKARGDAATYTLIPTDILQWAKMERLFREHRPEVVFHAAAFKHVPLMELHPDEAVLNNVKGTRIVAGLAGRYGAERVINISTDKAVDPVNVMGATKRATERLLQRLASRHPRTRYCSVRFGNVLGSRGSVVPIFQQQIANGGPVTITHPDMTRYLMMIEEAVQLVLQAAALAEEVPEERWCDLPDPLAGCGTHGVFVLEMGRPVNIVDLATQMIGLLYHDTERAIALEVTGIRPGERLHEQLFCHDEESVPTCHPMVHLARARPGNGSVLPADFDHRLGELLRVAERHAEPQEIIEALAACVPGYDPFDWTQVGTFPGAAERAAGLGAAAPAGAPAAEAMPEAATGAVSAPVGQVADVAPPGVPRTAAPAGRTARPDPAFAPTRA
jgi:FlaA1/EpsC-like NDP-sugar epimerase